MVQNHFGLFLTILLIMFITLFIIVVMVLIFLVYYKNAFNTLLNHHNDQFAKWGLEREKLIQDYNYVYGLNMISDDELEKVYSMFANLAATPVWIGPRYKCDNTSHLTHKPSAVFHRFDVNIIVVTCRLDMKPMYMCLANTDCHVPQYIRDYYPDDVVFN